METIFTTPVTDSDVRCAECGFSRQDVIDYANYWADQFGDRPIEPICCDLEVE